MNRRTFIKGIIVCCCLPLIPKFKKCYIVSHEGAYYNEFEERIYISKYEIIEKFPHHIMAFEDNTWDYYAKKYCGRNWRNDQGKLYKEIRYAKINSWKETNQERTQTVAAYL